MVHVRVVVIGAMLALLVGGAVFGSRWLNSRESASATAGASTAPTAGAVAPSVSTAVAGEEPRGTPSMTGRRSRRADRPVVALVHGMGRRPASMAPLGRGLVEAGFRVVNLGYPSWTESADSLAVMLADSVAACCGDVLDEVNFVTHSLGGILVRKYIEDFSPDHRGRVVMLSPPNGGSEIIDFVQTVPGLRALLGPTGTELGTDSTSLPNQLGPAHFELGVITGDRSLNPIYSWLIPGPDDGKVAVESAQRIEGAEQVLVVPFSHSFIMNREPVLEEVATFLLTGSFSEEARAEWEYIRPSPALPLPDSLLPDSAAADSMAAADEPRPTG